MGLFTKFLINTKNFIKSKRDTSVPLIESYRTFRLARGYFNNKYKFIEKRIKTKNAYKCIKFRENSNYSFLHQTIYDSNIEVLNIIMSQKYVNDPDIINDDNNNLNLTPAHLAGLMDKPDILEILQVHGADMFYKTKVEKLNLLHICSYNGSLKSLDWCLYSVFNENYKSWVNSLSEENWSPLHYACYHNKLDVSAYLIENGADIYLRNNQHLTPLDLAVMKDNFELFYCLYQFHYDKDKLKTFDIEQVLYLY